MDDLISRTQAIDALDVGAELLRRVLDDADIVGSERAKYAWGLGLIESCIADVKQLPSAQPEFAIDLLQNAPTIEPEREKGHWIETMEGNAYRRQCSVCKKLFIWNSNPRNFCGNCGAYMKGDTDE